MSEAESDGRESAEGGAATGQGFSEAQLRAIAGVVQRLLDRALTERGGSAGAWRRGPRARGPRGPTAHHPVSIQHATLVFGVCGGEGGRFAPGCFDITGQKGAGWTVEGGSGGAQVSV